jgi:hypothetical protein
MAINTNPTFKSGQKLTPEQLQQMLALMKNGAQSPSPTADGVRLIFEVWRVG